MKSDSEAIRSFYKFLDDENNKNGFLVEASFFEGDQGVLDYDDFLIDVTVNWQNSCVIFKCQANQMTEIMELDFQKRYGLKEAVFEYETIRDQLNLGILNISIKNSDKSMS